MSKIMQTSDGSYHWDCSIDRDYHRKFGKEGLIGILVLCVAVFVIYLIIPAGPDGHKDLWIPLLVIGVILVIALPLLYFWNSAEDPHEQYEMTETYVKSGYAKGAVFSEFNKTTEVVITERYLEMIGKYKDNRIYVPSEDMDFVREFILERVPGDAVIRHR